MTNFFNNKNLKLLLIVVCTFIIHSASAQKYVTTTGAGNKDGTTWNDAYDDAGFRVALLGATAGDAFWISAGNYKPDNVRDSSFRIPNGVKLYGGFSFVDTTWATRNWKTNITTFSGDIGTLNNATDNCYHVILLAGTDTSTVIDGFTIELGRANGNGNGRSNGAGIYNNGSGSGNSSSVTVRNCFITNNISSNDGGGMMDNGSLDGNVASIITNCIFYQNSGGNGGGLYAAGYNGNNTGTANTLATNCLFIENTCTSLGAGSHAHINKGTVRFVNCTFYANKATSGTGSAFYQYKGTGEMTNCIIYNNLKNQVGKSNVNANLYISSSLVQGGYLTGTYIINASPQFVDSTNYLGSDGYWGTNDDGLQIVEGSPAINWGLNDSIPTDITTDLIGNPRIIYNTADLGAYESPYNCTQVGITTTQTTLCKGNTLTFKAHSQFDGANAMYLWKVNGSSSGVVDSIFSSSSLNNKDIVTCYITSSLACSYPNNPVSNGIKVSVQTSPKLSITGNPCLGSVLTVSGATNASSIMWMQGNTNVYNSMRTNTGNGTTEAGDSSGSTGNDSTLLNGPNAVFVDAADNIYISDALNHRVQKWAKGSTYAVTVAGDVNGNSGNDSTKLNTPGGIFVDNIGNIYIADGLNHRVQKWAPGASYGTTVAGDKNGNPGTNSSSLYIATSVFVDDSAYIYVSDYLNNRVQKWAPDATSGTTVAGDASGSSGSGSAKLNGPIGLYVDTALNIYIADSKNNRVQKWAAGASNGTTVAGDKNGSSGSDSTKLNTPTGIYIDAAWNLYIADRFNNRVMKYMPGQNYGQNVAGDKNNTSGSGSVYLNQPTGVCTDANANVYISDVGNNRIQKWDQQMVNTTYTPTDTGIYYAVVNTTAGCTATSGSVTIINKVSPTIIVSASQLSVCAGTDITYSASTTFAGTNPSFIWMKNGTAVGTNDSTYTDTSTANNDSIYCILTSNMQCASPTQLNSNIIVIAVQTIPTAGITTNGNATFCQGDSLALYATAGAGNYSWLLNKNLLITSTDSIYYAKSSGDYQVIVSNGICADTSAIFTIQVLPVPVAKITPSGAQTFCQGDSVILYASTSIGYTYQWYDGTNAISGATDSIYIPKIAGSYIVKVSNGTCASASSSVNVTVNSLPSAQIFPSTNQTICAGDSIILQASTGSNYSYQWYDGSSTLSNATNASYITKTAGTYHVTVTSNGCSASSSAVTVTINPLPTVPTISRAGQVITATTAVSYQWYLNGSMITGATAKTYNTNNQNGKYKVQITDANGCKNQSADLDFVGINQTFSNLSISMKPNPTAGLFTINIQGIEGVAQVIIYDIAGREILSPSKSSQVEYNIADQPAGIYIVKVICGQKVASLKLIKE